MRRDKPVDYELGHGVRAWVTQYAPDRELNPNAGPDVIPCGLIIEHEDGCIGSVTFDLPGTENIWPAAQRWTLHSLDPISIDPSVLRVGAKNCAEADHTNCQHHNHHGFIHNGHWEPCADDGQPA